MFDALTASVPLLIILVLLVQLGRIPFDLWMHRRLEPTVKPEELRDLLHAAAMDCGMPLDLLDDDRNDLTHTGKIHELIYHATRRGGANLRTVQDVRQWLIHPQKGLTWPSSHSGK